MREVESVRLDSWKEIATFLRRDARTVRRWERERRLPVHRVPGGERSGVFAYTSELERWLHAVPAAAMADEAQERREVPSSAPEDKGKAAGAEASRVSASPMGDGLSEPGGAARSVLLAVNNFEGDLAEYSVGFMTAGGKSAEQAFAVEDEAGRTQKAGNQKAEDRAAGAGAGARPRVLDVLRSPSAQIGFLILLVALVAGVSIGVANQESRRTIAAHQPVPEAQDLYLRGRYYWNLRTEEGLNTAVDLFTQAIVNDPKYAAAYAGLADSYLLLRQYGHMRDSEAYPRALGAARQAVALDDGCPEAHRSLGFILRFWNWDMAAAESEYKRAIALNPKDSQTHHWYATALFSSGRMDEALAQIDMARTLEPHSISVLADRGLILGTMRPKEGLAVLQQLEQAEPGFLSTHIYLSGIYLEMKDYEGFLAESRKAAELSKNGDLVEVLDRAQKVLATRGPQPMLREMARGYAPLADGGSVAAYNAARLFALAAERDEAVRYLRLSYEKREPGFLGADTDPAFEPLHDVTAYRDLISRRDVAVGSGKQPIAQLDRPKSF